VRALVTPGSGAITTVSTLNPIKVYFKARETGVSRIYTSPGLTVVYRAHADRAGTEAEGASIQIPKRVHMLKVEHFGLDHRLQLGMLYRKRLARDRNEMAHFGRGDQPAQHAVPDHAGCTE